MYTMIPFYRRHNSVHGIFDELECVAAPLQPGRMAGLRTDVSDWGEYLLLEIELPGFGKEDIDLGLKNGVLTISARREESQRQQEDSGKYILRERQSGGVSRSFELSGIEEEAIAATFEHGVLQLKLPKQAQLLPQERKIAIE